MESFASWFNVVTNNLVSRYHEHDYLILKKLLEISKTWIKYWPRSRLSNTVCNLTANYEWQKIFWLLLYSHLRSSFQKKLSPNKTTQFTLLLQSGMICTNFQFFNLKGYSRARISFSAREMWMVGAGMACVQKEYPLNSSSWLGEMQSMESCVTKTINGNRVPLFSLDSPMPLQMRI